jgi:GT2 family glycosyltransferase
LVIAQPISPMKKVSIVIVNYNVKELLLQTSASDYATSKSLQTEIIVVDNDSKDDSVNAVKVKFPKVILIENKFNAGFSGANNQGMKIATGDYIFLLNPDTELKNDTTGILSNFLASHTNCTIVAPQLLNTDLSIQYSAWQNHSPINFIAETFYLHCFFSTINYPAEKFNSTFRVKTLSGAALFFDRKWLNELVGLDETLFWMEDIDFCFRAQQLGELYYCHEATVVHHSGQSQKKNYNVSISNQLLSKLKYYKKNFSSLWVWSANASCFIFILSRCFILSLLAPFQSIYNLKRKAYFYSMKRYWKYILFNDLSLT